MAEVKQAEVKRAKAAPAIDIGEPDLKYPDMSFIHVHTDILREADKGPLVLKLIELHPDRAVRMVGWVGGGVGITPKLTLGRKEDKAWAHFSNRASWQESFSIASSKIKMMGEGLTARMASGKSRIDSVGLQPVEGNIIFSHGKTENGGWINFSLKDPLDFGIDFDVYGGKHMGVQVAQLTAHTEENPVNKEALEKSLRKEAGIVVGAIRALADAKRAKELN